MKLHPAIEALLADIDDYVARTGMTRTAFGIKAAGNPNLYGRLRDGRNFTLQTLDRVRSFIEKEKSAA